MLLTYFKITFRNIWKHKVFSLINITGLAVASCLYLLIFWYVQNEKSYDNFFSNGNHVYRVEMTDLFDRGEGKPKNNFFSFLVKDDYNQKNMADYCVGTGNIVTDSSTNIKSSFGKPNEKFEK